MLCYAVLLLFICSYVRGGEYSAIPNVAYLTAANFTEHHSKGRWFMVFYLHSCGGCRAYEPTFRKFSSYFKDWDPILKVGTLDCELDVNRELCSNLKIDGVPNLRYFSEYRPWNATGLLLKVNKYSLPAVRDRLLELLKEEIPLEASNAESERLSAIISEITASDAVSTTPETLTTTPKPVAKDATEDEPAVLAPVYSDDIFKSLTILLYNNINLVEKIHQEELSALREFLSVLLKLLPASPTYKAKLSEISQWIDSIHADPTAAASFTGTAWLNKLNEIKFPEFTGDFVACRGSNSTYRGYPCGLWVLFHVLTVEHYRLSDKFPHLEGDAVAHAMNRFIPRFFSCTKCAFHFAANSANIARPGESILPKHRLEPSASEFTWNESIVSQLPPRPTTALEEVLWLNAVHNRVNKRLAGDVTEDPKAKKIQYPPRKFCPECWSQEPNNDGILVLGKTEETRTALLNFLVDHYKPHSWKTKNLDATFFEPSRHSDWEDNTSRDLLTIVIITVLLTLIALVALIILSRFFWGYRRQRMAGYKAPV